MVTFLIAGLVKGVIGLGLPTVSLALLTVAIDLPTAMALLLLPSFVTNLWQALTGGNARLVLQRLWPFLLLATVTVWIGAGALTRTNPALLSAFLGFLLVIYAGANLGGLRITISPQRMGLVNGVLTGMTGSFVVPGVMFLQAIGLSREVLIQAMGMLFALSTLALAIALQRNALLTTEHWVLSSTALLPAILGMVFGRRIRQAIPEQLFRKVFFISLLLLGTYIIFSALWELPSIICRVNGEIAAPPALR
jgi:uncharacterized membrane protein YfcA